MSLSSSQSTIGQTIGQTPVQLKLDRLLLLTGGNNYHRWVGSWEITFDVMGLLEFLTKTTPIKSEAQTDEFEKWHNANKQLRGLLLNAVDELLQTVVIDCQSAKEAWDQLKAQFN